MAARRPRISAAINVRALIAAEGSNDKLALIEEALLLTCENLLKLPAVPLLGTCTVRPLGIIFRYQCKRIVGRAACHCRRRAAEAASPRKAIDGIPHIGSFFVGVAFRRSDGAMLQVPNRSGENIASRPAGEGMIRDRANGYTFSMEAADFPRIVRRVIVARRNRAIRRENEVRRCPACRSARENIEIFSGAVRCRRIGRAVPRCAGVRVQVRICRKHIRRSVNIDGHRRQYNDIPFIRSCAFRCQRIRPLEIARRVDENGQQA